MEHMDKFKCDSSADVQGTYHLIDLPDVSVDQMKRAFGAPSVEAYIDEEKGYEGDEWYFTHPDGRVYTVYARWGCFRVGGRGESHSDFAQWFRSKLNAAQN